MSAELFANRQVASSSDIDLFIYGLDEKAALKKILDIEAVVRKNQRLAPDTGLALRTENAITFISPRWPYRHVQVGRLQSWPTTLLGHYSSIFDQMIDHPPPV